MTAGRVRLTRILALLVPIALLSGCGQGGIGAAPPSHALPILPGARIVAEATQCDRGSNSFCSRQLVVTASSHRSSKDLLDAEHTWIHRHGWRGVAGDTGDERAALSPDEKLHVTYATADGDLRGIDLGWIRRSPAIADALSRTLFDHAPAMSMMLETGAS